FYILAGLLVIGFIANLLVRPVAPKWHMSEAEVAAEQAKLRTSASAAATGSFGIGKGGLDFPAFIFWSLVGVPLAWGVWTTLQKALVFFH
ncbi:MAG: MFS transporter, partial [Hyphomicrobium sp.]